jgi:hypothetical protein
MFNKYTPLWLPKGSVRALLAFLLTGTFVVAVFNLPLEQVAVITPITLMIVKDYFADRKAAEE